MELIRHPEVPHSIVRMMEFVLAQAKLFSSVFLSDEIAKLYRLFETLHWNSFCYGVTYLSTSIIS